MADQGQSKFAVRGSSKGTPNLFHLGGYRYWTASLLPVAVGSALPFWLRPAEFTFQWVAAIEFLIAAALFHAGFSLLHTLFEGMAPANWPKTRFWVTGSTCIVVGCLIGLHLNNTLALHASVPQSIFSLYGIMVLFVGVLYVVPPLNFSRRATGEVVLSIGLGLMPILGAYLIQVGDITRSVYLAALPVVAATGLWVWTGELASRADDERAGRKTMVMMFPLHISGRYVVLLLAALIYVTLALAVLVRSSLNPWSLVAFLTLPLAVRILIIAWRGFDDETVMPKVRGYAVLLHLSVCVIITASSLTSSVRP